MKIYDLKTDYQKNALATGLTPCFSFKYEGAAKTTAYRVTVSSCRDGNGDCWDTGVVSGAAPACIVYAGKPLRTRSAYYWAVTLYDGEKSVTSDRQVFETAPASSEFLGTWMSMPVNNQGGTALFRKRVTLRSLRVARARAYVCGLGYHELQVNGVKVGRAVLAPAVSDYSKRLYYNTYDILPCLRAGDNVFGIEVGHGWMGAKKVLAQFYITYEDGQEDEFHSFTNSGWWVGGSPTVDNSIYGGETYDARIEDVVPKNWATADFEPQWNTGWMFTIFSPAPTGVLQPQPVEDIEVCDTYYTVSATKKEENVWVYDVGANIAGWARIRVRGKRGDTVTLRYGERLTDDGYVNRINLRTAKATDTYILRGDGEEEYAPRFTYHGFQYVEVQTTGDARVLSLVGEHVHTATSNVGRFECSMPALNALHVNAVRTEYNNQHGVLTDCPQRDERFGWLNDWSSRLYQTVYNCGMERFFAKTLTDISDTQLDDGGIADTAPYYTGGRPADPVCVAYLLLPLWCYRYYGDSRPAREAYPKLRKWVQCLLSHSKEYIMDYSYYGDWVYPACYENERADGLFISTAHLYWHLDLMHKLADIVGDGEDASLFARHAEKCAQSINKTYFHADTGNYSRGAQAENAIALSLGIVPEAYRAVVAENVYRSVKEHNHHSTCGNIGYRHLFYMLAEYGHADEAINVLTNPEYPGWGFMLSGGATSVWERWEKEMDVEMDSFDHPMFGSYDAFFYRYLGGIGVCDDAVGADKIVIAPVCPETLQSVHCTFTTARGKAVSDWKRENGKVLHHIEIPSGTTAYVTVGGKTAAYEAGVYDLQA